MDIRTIERLVSEGMKLNDDEYKHYNDLRGLSAVTVNTVGMIINEWKLTRIDQGYSMTRVEGDTISIRPLTFWEKIKYFRKMMSF